MPRPTLRVLLTRPVFPVLNFMISARSESNKSKDVVMKGRLLHK